MADSIVGHFFSDMKWKLNPIRIILIFLIPVLVSCQKESPNSTPHKVTPEVFLPEFIPQDQLAHAGVFSPDQQDYYFTISDIEFATFTVMRSHKQGNEWTRPDTAFFNSNYNEHGVHFTTDGQTLYFSSTRPVGADSIPNTWHIWYCKLIDGTWNTPEFLNFTQLHKKLISHPSSTGSGRLYFHVANTDYSKFGLYFADQSNGQFSIPQKVILPSGFNSDCITPFVSPDESYLIFAKIIEGKEELYISYSTNNVWGECIRLNEQINTNNLGNPYVTPDNKFLYYSSGNFSTDGTPYNWMIQKISTSTMLP